MCRSWPGYTLFIWCCAWNKENQTRVNQPRKTSRDNRRQKNNDLKDDGGPWYSITFSLNLTICIKLGKPSTNRIWRCQLTVICVLEPNPLHQTRGKLRRTNRTSKRAGRQKKNLKPLLSLYVGMKRIKFQVPAKALCYANRIRAIVGCNSKVILKGGSAN